MAGQRERLFIARWVVLAHRSEGLVFVADKDGGPEVDGSASAFILAGRMRSACSQAFLSMTPTARASAGFDPAGMFKASTLPPSINSWIGGRCSAPLSVSSLAGGIAVSGCCALGAGAGFFAVLGLRLSLLLRLRRDAAELGLHNNRFGIV